MTDREILESIIVNRGRCDHDITANECKHCPIGLYGQSGMNEECLKHKAKLESAKQKLNEEEV